MNKLSPLQIVKEKFGSKEKLVDKVTELIAKGKEEKEELKERLLQSTNKKLLRLYEIGSKVKKEFGSKEKLVDKILLLQSRTKDIPYRDSLASMPLPKLFDIFKGSSKRNK